MRLRCEVVSDMGECTSWLIEDTAQGDPLGIVVDVGKPPQMTPGEAAQLYMWGMASVMGPFLVLFAAMVVVRGIQRFYSGR